MYRALALKALRSGATLDSEEEVGRLAERSRIELGAGGCDVLLDGAPVGEAIRSPT